MCISKGNSLIRWYKQQKQWDDAFPGDIPDDVIDNVVIYLDGLLETKKANCCMNYAYILMKCLDAIGETEYATSIDLMYKRFFDNKRAQYEATWSRAFAADEDEKMI
jgi:hypothetical protein